MSAQVDALIAELRQTRSSGRAEPVVVDYDTLIAALEALNAGAGGGDVVGPAGATANALVRFDGATGKLIKNSTWVQGDTGSTIGGAGATLSLGSANAVPANNQLAIASDVGASFTATTYANSVGAPQLVYRKARGTEAVPLAVQQNDFTALWFFQGFDGAAYRINTEFRSVVIEPVPGPTAMGGEGQFFATQLGTITRQEVLRYNFANGLSMYGANPVIDGERLFRLRQFTVAQLNALPGLTAGMRAAATDATAPAYLAVLVGGGAVNCPAYYDGANWVSA